MQSVIYLKGLRHLIDPVDKSVPRRPLNVQFCKLDGEIVNAQNVTCTSGNFENDTFNFKFPESNEIRTVHASLLLSLNGKEVML